MKAKLIIIIVIILFIANILPVIGTVIIDKTPFSLISSNTLYVGGDGPGNFSKIQDALDNASLSDTIFVYDDSSPYLENILIDKSIILKGENKYTTIIDGNGNSDVVYILADDVVISDFTIQNIGSNFDKGINTHYHQANISIINNRILHNNVGIYLNNSRNVLIKENNISFGEHGIFITISGNIIVEKNNISYNKWGTKISHSTVTISENIISNNEVKGIIFVCDGSVKIENNYISCNLSDFTGDCGIEIHGNNNIISGNTITNSDNAISMHWSSKNRIVGNNICSNRDIMWLDNSNRNIISKNNFINNENNGKEFTFFNSYFNKWENNYWNRARILPYFIFGNIEIGIFKVHFIRWFNIDWHPAQKPYDISI